MKYSPSRQDPVLAQCEIQRFTLPETATGIDVGEDFLDLAVLRTRTMTVEHHRIALCGIEAAPLEMLGERLRACCPDVGPRWLALIDSPRWPLDLDCSKPALVRRDPVPAGRLLDSALRAILRASPSHAAMRLSMFPTPRLDYFTRCARRPTCKPHLRAAYMHLFEPPDRPANPDFSSESASAEGGNFTRFMLAGFLAFKAFQSLDAQTLEAYPELQFRLSMSERLLPKRAGEPALAQRVAINRKLRRVIRIKRSPPPASLDQADAEILVLSTALAARRGSLGTLGHPAEGRFLLTIQPVL
jgi:hypothetical protein